MSQGEEPCEAEGDVGTEAKSEEGKCAGLETACGSGLDGAWSPAPQRPWFYRLLSANFSPQMGKEQFLPL